MRTSPKKQLSLISCHARSALVMAFSFLLSTSCSAPRYDNTTLDGKAAILDAVNNDLTAQNCSAAIFDIEGLYGSVNSDNQVRLARASAHGCNAGINFFKLLGDMGKVNFAGGIWNSFAQLFYDASLSSLATKVTSGGLANDALLASINPGTVIATANRVGVAPNLGSVFPTDRTADANAYLLFLSFTNIGNIENLYGAPDPVTFKKAHVLGFTATQVDGWAKAANVTADACAYSASILNMLDAIGAISQNLPAQLKVGLQVFGTGISSVIADACNAGCRGLQHPIGAPAIVGLFPMAFDMTGCNFMDDNCRGTDANPCLQVMRDRSSCTGVPTDRASCAAAGIANFINQHPVLGWPGP